MTRALILNAVSTPEQARKFSLDHQEATSRTYCTAQGWEVIDSLRSNTSRSKHDNIDDIAKVNKAFASLKRHIEAKDFDVLVIHSFDRLARDSALITQIIQRIILAGASIYSHQGGTVDATNYLILCGSIAFMVAAPIRVFVEKTQVTKEKQLKAGLHVQGRTLMIHRITRDGNGKRIGMEIDESVRPLFTRLVALLCDAPDRLSWTSAASILNKEGYRTRAGKPLRGEGLYRTVVHPEFWGHTARRYARELYSYKGRYSYEWIFDPDVAPPAELQIYHNTHPAFLSEPEASKLKARLRQDFALKGKAAHGNFISAFSGLVICKHCGMSMGWRNRKKVFASCEARWYRPPACDRPNIVYETTVHDALDKRLREMIASGDLRAVSPAEAAVTAQSTGVLQAAIAAAQRELAGLLRDKANTSDPDVLSTYTELIVEAASRLKSSRAQLDRVQAETISDEPIALVTAPRRKLSRLPWMASGSCPRCTRIGCCTNCSGATVWSRTSVQL